MSARTDDLLRYAVRLAGGGALGEGERRGRRLGEYVDWSEAVLEEACARWDERHVGTYGVYVTVAGERARVSQAEWTEIKVALVAARGAAADRAYRRRTAAGGWL